MEIHKYFVSLIFPEPGIIHGAVQGHKDSFGISGQHAAPDNRIHAGAGAAIGVGEVVNQNISGVLGDAGDSCGEDQQGNKCKAFHGFGGFVRIGVIEFIGSTILRYTKINTNHGKIKDLPKFPK
jgi:hypothetical protein